MSLDGVKDIHNFIRGNDNSYNNAINLLDFLKEFENITVYVSTVLMKYNEDGYSEFRNFIKNRYPNFIHTTDIVFPSGNAINNDECYNRRDLINLAEKMPYLFMAKKKDGDNKIRCTGGFSQCSIEPNGDMKICNAATDKRFKFKHNCFKVGLKRAWEDCGHNIITFRNEKPKSNKECASCKFNSTCTTTNCRLLAYFYNGSELTNSPLTCILERNNI